jgi:hypothetical protein
MMFVRGMAKARRKKESQFLSTGNAVVHRTDFVTMSGLFVRAALNGFRMMSFFRFLTGFVNRVADFLIGIKLVESCFILTRSSARQRGLPNPYLVVMTWHVKGARALVTAAGLDAISAYVFQGGDRSTPYQRLTTVIERFWDEQRRTGAKVIPLAMSGWDRRPRVMSPVPWEHFTTPIDQYYEPPTPGELDWAPKKQAKGDRMIFWQRKENQHEEDTSHDRADHPHPEGGGEQRAEP